MDNPLDKLLNNTYTVHLPGVDIDVPCLDIPFTLFGSIIARLTKEFRDEMIESRVAMATALSELARGDAEDGEDAQDLQKVFAVATPALIRLVTSVPDIATDVLKRVLIDATPEHVEALSVSDASVILGTAFERIDTDVLARNIKQVFFKATDAWAKAKPAETETEETTEKVITDEEE